MKCELCDRIGYYYKYADFTKRYCNHHRTGTMHRFIYKCMICKYKDALYGTEEVQFFCKRHNYGIFKKVTPLRNKCIECGKIANYGTPLDAHCREHRTEGMRSMIEERCLLCTNVVFRSTKTATQLYCRKHNYTSIIS